MSQNDFVIDNQTTPLFRADLNNALQALASNSSGPTEPSVTYANQFWYDESTDILKMRSEANDAWINIGTLNQSTNVFTPAGLTNLTQAQVQDTTSTVFGQVSGQRLSQAVASFSTSYTDEQARSAQAGHLVNSIGSYRQLFCASTTILRPGNTVAGSNLRQKSVGAGEGSTNNMSTNLSSGDTFEVTSVAGTWRFMGQEAIRMISVSSNQKPSGFFLRIS